jgi:hypothetical protein
VAGRIRTSRGSGSRLPGRLAQRAVGLALALAVCRKAAVIVEPSPIAQPGARPIGRYFYGVKKSERRRSIQPGKYPGFDTGPEVSKDHVRHVAPAGHINFLSLPLPKHDEAAVKRPERNSVRPLSADES